MHIKKVNKHSSPSEDKMNGWFHLTVTVTDGICSYMQKVVSTVPALTLYMIFMTVRG